MARSLQVALVLAFIALTVIAPVRAQQRQALDSETAATARRFLELVGGAQVALRAMERALPAQRAANPQIPSAFWDAFVARARRSMPQLVDSMVPIYAAHFTRAELEQLVQFYQSPLGRHLTEVQPVLAQEGGLVGQRWGASIAREVGDSFARAGVHLQAPPNPH